MCVCVRACVYDEMCVSVGFSKHSVLLREWALQIISAILLQLLLLYCYCCCCCYYYYYYDDDDDDDDYDYDYYQ